MVSDTGMEYTNITMEVYTMDSGKRIIKMATDITRRLMAENITDNGRVTKDREMQSKMRMGNYTL